MKKAGDILNDYMRNFHSKLDSNYSSVIKNWSKIVGEDMISHSSVKDLTNGILLIETDHPGWVQLLQMKKKKILNNIDKYYPELDIINIRFILKSNNK